VVGFVGFVVGLWVVGLADDGFIVGFAVVGAADAPSTHFFLLARHLPKVGIFF
jgi:hypothetical protein